MDNLLEIAREDSYAQHLEILDEYNFDYQELFSAANSLPEKEESFEIIICMMNNIIRWADLPPEYLSANNFGEDPFYEYYGIDGMNNEIIMQIRYKTEGGFISWEVTSQLITVAKCIMNDTHRPILATTPGTEVSEMCNHAFETIYYTEEEIQRWLDEQKHAFRS